MDSDDKEVRPERVNTDKSLRTERDKTDRALAESQAAVEADADEVVRLARETADAVLLKARDKADQDLAQTAPKAGARAIIANERAREDEALGDERASADVALQRERDEDALVLARLLPFDRDETDRTLLTERNRSDEALSNRDDFLSIVSHDLRNLLAGIVVSATLLSERAGENENGAQLRVETTRIQRYASRMNRLIGDLLDVASIDAGQLAVTPASGDLTALMGEAVDLFQALASAKGIALEMQVEGPLPAEFDHDRMLQVLANLITNSIKFTSRGGKIWVRAVRAEDELRLSVSDTGSGIPSDLLDAVFERFWQVTKGDRRGLGLGLYISRCIVEAHGGKIWAESKLGEGSTFWFTLPGAGAPQSQGGASPR